MANPSVSVIIAAAGSSRRMGTTTSSKQLLEINTKPIIEYSIAAFSNSEYVDDIIIVTKSEDIEPIKTISKKYPKVKHITLGGAERFDSVKLAFNWVPDSCDIVAIHDAARPLVTTGFINRLILSTKNYGAVCPVGKMIDTVKVSDNGLTVANTLDRNLLFTAQTPQMFQKNIYKHALDNAKESSKVFTDDASIVESAGYKVHIEINESPNIKITTPGDVDLGKLYLKEQKEMRIGHGYDVHKLVENRDLILGGVKIDYSHGLLGHSDADVLIHAVMDALIGAMGLGDIGKHFPDSDNNYKGISSILLLHRVNDMLNTNGYSISNIDATIIAQKPKLLPYIDQMKRNISEALSCRIDLINIKATTEEGLGFTGALEGISAHAVALIKKN